MIVPVCPSCNRFLADKEIPFKKGMKAICNDKSLSEKQQMSKKKKLLDDLGLERYCCRTRVIGALDQVRLII